MMHGRRTDEGFTLPELLTVGVALIVLVVVATLIIRPNDFGPEARNGQRWTGVAQIAQGLKQYKADHGALPQDLPDTALLLSSDEGGYDLCPYLVPAYMDDLPMDPQIGLNLTSERCIDNSAAYMAGYTIAREADGSVVVAAPTAEAGEQISLRITP